MNARYRVCERCHGTGGDWVLNLVPYAHGKVWVRCPGCGGSRSVIDRPAAKLTPEQNAALQKMLSTLDTLNTTEPADLGAEPADLGAEPANLGTAPAQRTKPARWSWLWWLVPAAWLASLALLAWFVAAG